MVDSARLRLLLWSSSQCLLARALFHFVPALRNPEEVSFLQPRSVTFEGLAQGAEMRGRLLSFDFRSGKGEISGLDGQRYRFADSHWVTPGRPHLGQLLDFEAMGEEAV